MARIDRAAHTGRLGADESFEIDSQFLCEGVRRRAQTHARARSRNQTLTERGKEAIRLTAGDLLALLAIAAGIAALLGFFKRR